MFTLCIANKNYSSWSLRPWVLMRELGIPFTEALTPFSDKQAPGSVFTRSPTGKVPCLIDGETTVWDSLAIIEYLAESVPQVWPESRQARAWARSAAAEMHSGFPIMRDFCTMNCGLRIDMVDVPEGLVSEFGRLDELWTQGLSRFGGAFLAGPAFTAVDAVYAPVAFRVKTYNPPLSTAARQYADRLLALPAMQDWYKAALKETWRDDSHEQEARRAGTWLEDARAV